MERAIGCIKGASATVEIEVDGHLLAARAAGNTSRDGTLPSQYDLLLASLVACTALTLRQFAADRGWPLESLDVYVTLERGPDGMHVDRMLFVTGLDCERQETLLNLARMTPLTVLLGRGMSISTILI